MDILYASYVWDNPQRNKEANRETQILEDGFFQTSDTFFFDTAVFLAKDSGLAWNLFGANKG